MISSAMSVQNKVVSASGLSSLSLGAVFCVLASRLILYLFHTLTIPLCYPLPAGLTAPFTYTIPYFSKKRNSFHSHLTIFNIFLFLHAVFPNQKLSKISLLYPIHCGTVGDSRDGWDSTFLFLVPVRARTSYSFLLDLLVHYLFFNSPFNALISLVSR